MPGYEQEPSLMPQPCSRCEGKGGACTACAGSGRIVAINGISFAWKQSISRLQIEVDEWKERVRAQIGMAALFAVVGGIAALGAIIYADGDARGVWQRLTGGGDPLALPVWVGVLVCSYFIYHVRRGELSMPTVPHVMKRRKKGDEAADISPVFSPSARRIVAHGYLLGCRLGTREASAIHLFASAMTDPTVGILLSRLAIDSGALIERVKRVLYRKELSTGLAPLITVHWHDALLRAFAHAAARGSTRVEPTDLVVALAHPACEDVADVLLDLAITEQKVRHVAEWIALHRALVRQARHLRGRAVYKPKGAMNRTYTSVATPALDALSRDLTSYARRGALPLNVGREHEVSEIFRIFSAGGRGVLLVGEEGTGKTALVSQIAQQMTAEDVPAVFRDKRLVELSIPALIAGGSARGGIEQTLLRMGHEIRRAGNVILAVEHAHTLVGARSAGGESFDLAGVLAELMEQGHLRVIATTTPAEARAFIEQSPLGNLLQRIDVVETDREQTIRVLESKAPLLEARFGCFYSYPALEKVVDLATRYITAGHLPDKAIRLMEEVGEQAREERGARARVSPDDVAGVVSLKMKIPLTSITEDEGSVLLNFEARLHERIIGQDDAVRLVAQAIRRGRVEMRDVKRPIASFLFLGPTGVGKTEVARAVAALYFGDETHMVRCDMSEYQGSDALVKMLGGAAGGAEGQLTAQVRARPFSLVLLDEFEKASGEVLNLFLQVFEDGRLTDSRGRVADFRNTIIIATSNVGAGVILDAIRAGEPIDRIRTRIVQDELPRLLRPELLNRFDGIVVFAPLSIEQVRQITRLMLQRVERELNEKGMVLTIEEVAVFDLAREGYDPVYGARPLRRLIQERIEDPIAKFILSGQLQRRDAVILGYGGAPRVEKAPPL